MAADRWLLNVEKLHTGEAKAQHFRLQLSTLDRAEAEPKHAFHTIEDLWDALLGGVDVAGLVLIEESCSEG